MGKNRVLFVTNRNILNTCGELRLIKNRAEVLFDSYGISTDFFTLTHKKSIRPERIEAGGEIKSFHYSLRNPLSLAAAKKELKRSLDYSIRKKKYDIAIVSGAAMLPFIEYIKEKSPECLIFVDCHGAYEELIEFDNTSKLKTLARHYIYRLWKDKERKYIPVADHVLAVSEGLKRYIEREYRIDPERIHVVPCSIRKPEIDLNELIKNRAISRRKYGIEDDEILFVYSGGTSKWQCIDETVEVFNRISEKQGKAKLLLLSADRDYILKYKRKNVIIDSLTAEEIDSTLPAGDFAFLLRDDFITNRVAYPNKFLEYVSAGVQIISTPFVEDIASSIQEYEIGYVLPNTQYEERIQSYIEERKNSFGKDINKRIELLADVCFDNRLKFIVDL